MSDIDISLLHRLVQTAVAGNPELQAIVQPLMAAADSDGQANAEDLVLTDAEINNYITRLRQESSSSLSILTRNREQLVGSLSSGRQRLQSEHASEELQQLLAVAAAQDPDHENSSAEEIEALLGELRRADEQARSLNAADLSREVNGLLDQLRQMEQTIPEAFVPEEPAAQRAPIDLNFLKHLPPTVFEGEDEQAQMLQNLLHIGGIDPNDRNADWSISYEEMQSFRDGLPAEARSGFPSLEVTMANFRFLAFNLREEINHTIAEIGAEVPEFQQLGVRLQPLIDRRSQIQDPRVDQIIELGGDDGVLTTLDVERHLQLLEQRNPGFLQGMLAQGQTPQGSEGQSDLQRATAIFMAGARSLVESYGAEAVQPAGTTGSGPAPFDRNLYLSRQVLDDLQRMRAGFTHRDRQYAEENSLAGFVDFVSWVCTFGGALTWLGGGSPRPQTEEEIQEYHADFLPRVGPTYRHFLRESVEGHDSERGCALNTLRMILEHPPRDFTGDRSIPNALNYLYNHREEYRTPTGLTYHQMLTGDLFQARRLWDLRARSDEDLQHEFSDLNPATFIDQLGLRGMTDPQHATDPVNTLIDSIEHRRISIYDYRELQWYRLAMELDSGMTSMWRSDAHTDGISNLDYSRAILHALARESTNPQIRRLAHRALQDVQGQDITTEQGEILGDNGWQRYRNQGGGEFGIWPVDWFRNYSSENRDGAVSDAVLLVSSLFIGGGVFSGGRTVATATGRAAMTAGFLRFLGVRATGAVVTATTEAAAGAATAETATAGAGWFSRMMARMAARRVIAAEAMLESATNNAERTAARQALARAHAVQRILTSPTLVTTAAETALPRTTGFLGRIAGAHPPVPAALTRAVAGTGTRAVLARSSVWALERISLRGLGSSLRFLSYEGIVTYGIAGYAFEHLPRHSNHPGIFDREYELHLPERSNPQSRAEPSQGPRHPSRAGRQLRRRATPLSATGAIRPGPLGIAPRHGSGR